VQKYNNYLKQNIAAHFSANNYFHESVGKIKGGTNLSSVEVK